MGWDRILGYLAWHEAYCLCVGNHTGHNLHTRGWGDMKVKGQPNRDSTRLNTSASNSTFFGRTMIDILGSIWRNASCSDHCTSHYVPSSCLPYVCWSKVDIYLNIYHHFTCPICFTRPTSWLAYIPDWLLSLLRFWFMLSVWRVYCGISSLNFTNSVVLKHLFWRQTSEFHWH